MVYENILFYIRHNTITLPMTILMLILVWCVLPILTHSLLNITATIMRKILLYLLRAPQSYLTIIILIDIAHFDSYVTGHRDYGLSSARNPQLIRLSGKSFQAPHNNRNRFLSHISHPPLGVKCECQNPIWRLIKSQLIHSLTSWRQPPIPLPPSPFCSRVHYCPGLPCQQLIKFARHPQTDTERVCASNINFLNFTQPSPAHLVACQYWLNRHSSDKPPVVYRDRQPPK